MGTQDVFSIFDTKAKAFLKPFHAPNAAVATRQFQAAVQDPQHEFNRFAEDYSLFRLGEFDEETGEFRQPNTPEAVVTALALKEQ